MVVEWSFVVFALKVGVMRLLKAFLADNRGATAIEYGLIAAIICTALISGLGFFTNALQNVFNVINNNLPAN